MKAERKTDLTDQVSKPRRDPGRAHRLEGKCSARCKAAKHEDWQHGLTGCAVGPQGAGHCECEAHWVEIRPAAKMQVGEAGPEVATRFGQ